MKTTKIRRIENESGKAGNMKILYAIRKQKNIRDYL
jgi:hypothetical protein